MNDISNRKFCTHCSATSGLSIFDCSRRKNSQYCPYKLAKPKGKALLGESIKVFILPIISVLSICFILSISLGAISGIIYPYISQSLFISIFTLIIPVLIAFSCLIIFHKLSTNIYNFYSESPETKLQVIQRWNKLPHKYKLQISKPLNLEVDTRKIFHPASLNNINDFNKSRRSIDNACKAFMNSFIILATQGFTKINQISYFNSSKRSDFILKITLYYWYINPNYKDKPIQGILENICLEKMGDSSASAKETNEIISEIYVEDRTWAAEWLFDNFLQKEAIQKGWGLIQKDKHPGTHFELDNLDEEQIQRDKETIEELSQKLRKQHTIFLSHLKKRVTAAIQKYEALD